MPFIKTIAIQKVKTTVPSGPALPNPTCAVAAGEHSLYSNSTGRVWGWGLNTQGQVGNNSITDVATPVSVLGAAKTFLKIAASQNHSLAIDKNGQVWAWGWNGQGQLGDNSVTSRRTPVSVAGGVKTIYEISVGQNNSYAIDGTGLVWSWGFNSSGQLGDNTTISKNTPVSIAGARKTFCKISSGDSHVLGLTNRGEIWAWGSANGGRLGDNQQVTNRCTPVSVLGTTKTFCKIAAGTTTSYAIDKNGRVWSWGVGSAGQLGNNTTFGFQLTPVSILGVAKTFCEISGGTSYALALDKNGRAWGWGFNGAGNLGDFSNAGRCTPVSVAGVVKTFCRIVAGRGSTVNHSLAIDKNGLVWAWGSFTNGRLGNATIGSRTSPMSVLGTVRTFSFVSAGQSHTVAIDKNGRAWAWGSNSFFQLGDSTLADRCTPVSVAGTVKTFCQIVASSFHNLALDRNGRAWAWGLGTLGRLGDNQAASNRSTPVAVLGTTKTFCRIAVGFLGSHSLAIDRYGRAWAWGNPTNGRLGDNQNITCRLTPVSVLGAAKTFCQIAAGNVHSLAIDRYGRAWAWGSAANGRLGDNQVIQSRFTPVSVLGAVKTFCQISGGQNHSLAIDRYGRVWGWGLNTSGPIGDGTQLSKITPVSVAGAVKTFCQISAGATYSLAIDKNGRLWSWGANALGQLGDGTLTSRLTPVSVVGAVKTFCRITAGNAFSLAIDRYGRAWAWGDDSSGQLGLNTRNILTPVRVCVI